MEEGQGDVDPPPLQAAEQDDEDVCRICYQGASENPLFHPCKCSGTSKYIHEACWKSCRDHTPTLTKECAVCRYEVQTVETVDSAVTWSIYAKALGKYLLSFLLMFLSFVPWSIASQYTFPSVKSFVNGFSSGAFVNRNRIGRIVFGQAYKDGQLPYFLDDDRISTVKIGDISLWQIVKHDGLVLLVNSVTAAIYLLLQYLVTLVWSFKVSDVSSAIVNESGALAALHSPEESIVSSVLRHLPSGIPPDYILCAVLGFAIGSMLFSPSVASKVLIVTHFCLVGSVVTFSATIFCRGWIVELYLSLLTYQKLGIMAVMGGWILIFIRQFSDVYFSNTEVEDEPFLMLHWTSEMSLRENMKKNAKLLVLSASYIWACFVLPLATTHLFFPHWLFLGEYVHLNSIASLTVLTDRLIKMVLIAVLVYQARLRYDWLFKMQEYVYRNFFGYERESNQRLSVELDIALWMPLLGIVVTLYYWSLVALGSSVFHLVLTPTYFDSCRDDLLVHVTIGLLVLRLVSSNLSALLKDAFLLTKCFFILFAYVMSFTKVEYCPVRPERVFALVALLGSLLFAQVQTIDEELILLSMFGVITAVHLFFFGPARIIWYMYGYNNVSDAFSSAQYAAFIAGTASIMIALLSIMWLILLYDHLRREHGRIVERLVNYEGQKASSMERLRTFLWKHKNWSIYSVVLNFRA